MAPESFYTEGCGLHRELRLPLRVLGGPDGDGLHQPCLKLVLFTAGAGVVPVGRRRVTVISPALLCLNHRESAAIPAALQHRAVLFLPELLNGSATMGVLETLPAAGTSVSTALDTYWVAAFRLGTDTPAQPIALPPLAFRRLDDGIDRLRRELAEQVCRFWPSCARAFLGEALFLTAQLFHNPAADPTAPADFPAHPAAPIVLALRSRYQERHTLAALAREFHTNRTTLQKRFRDYTGKTIVAYLRELRLAMARTLLTGTTEPVHEIAYRIGFADLTSFTRAFRRTYRLTPARYRRQHRSG